MKAVKIIGRIIIVPALLISTLLIDVCISIIRVYKFLSFGGEFISYGKNTKKTILDVYNELKNHYGWKE